MRITLGRTTSDLHPFHLLILLWLLYIHPATRPLLHSLLRLDTLLSPTLLHLGLIGLGLACVVLPVLYARGLWALLRAVAGLVGEGIVLVWRPGREFLRGAAHGVFGPRPAAREARMWMRWMAYVLATALMWAMLVAWVYLVLVTIYDGLVLLGLARWLPGGGPDGWMPELSFAHKTIEAQAEDDGTGVLACYSRRWPEALWVAMQDSFVGRARWRFNVDGTCTPLPYQF
ncbi:hypothetical protein F4810DRAFT_332778 [Camillea tinctor]|nr:hypothetical protein F4810DRAFT_332778 [Camillea tinctor]